jgi:MoaA/NifB/PqqE/SkfB family radical SAM enzyme
VHLDFIVRRDNEHEVQRLSAFAESLGVGYVLMQTSLNLRFLAYDRMMRPRGLGEADLRRQRLECMDRWLPQDDSAINPVYRRVRTNGGRMPDASSRIFQCTDPWNTMVVCWDGDVNLCCGSFEKRHSVGNVFEASVRSVWNNAYYRAARRSLRDASRAGDPWVLCKTCPGMLL